jgi:hypothetical protein
MEIGKAVIERTESIENKEGVIRKKGGRRVKEESGRSEEK